MKPDALSQVINGAGMDIRQIFNHLSVWTAADKTLDAEQAQKEAKAAKKDIVLGPWEVCRKVFSKEEHKTMSIADKSRLFFYDYSLNPLFIQENYLQAVPDCPRYIHISFMEIFLARIKTSKLIVKYRSMCSDCLSPSDTKLLKY